MADRLEGRFAFEGSGLPALTVAIQAGGESRRMGRSKATVPFLGRPLIERLVTRVAPISDEILITTNEADRLAFLREHPAADRIRMCSDVYDRRGSLTGMVTALRNASNDYVAVCACDMVFVSPELFLAEYRCLLDDPTLDLVLPRTQFGYEPFHGVYRRRTCLEGLTRAVDDGVESIRGFVSTMTSREFTMDEVGAIVPQGRCFVNANTPDELRHAERLVLELEGAAC
ncbi:MAG: molybdenum cofactor guanylyltransferase [Coriobacteriales bacterium]